jgi:hypothetical protein
MTHLSGSGVLQFSSPRTEFLLVCMVFLVLASLWPRLFARACGRVERIFARFAQYRVLAVCSLFLAVATIRLLILPRLPVPVPGIHDEFSYLLMADTFAHGRLASPPHPMWMSFETFHVNWFPTYSSMYPPLQGLVLALGQTLGNPWIGVLLSDAAMCAAILWMLQGWMPARWAFLGGVLVALKFGFASYWMNSYWGGAVAATGGALVLGAFARMVRHARIRDALLMGLGTAILANSRPYEGLLFCVPVALYLFWWLAGKTRPFFSTRTRFRKVAAPLAIVLLLTGAWIGFYNWRLTGHALLFPNALNVRTYHTASMFVFGKAKPPREYNNAQFEDFYSGFERDEYRGTWSDFSCISRVKVTRISSAFFWLGAVLALPGLPFVFRDRKMRLLIVILPLVIVGVFAVIWSNAHYAAPLMCVIFALLIQSIRHLRTMRPGKLPIGKALSWAAVLLLAVDTTAAVAHRECDPLAWTCQGDPSRAVIQKTLEHAPGKHLVVVRYEDEHNIHDEWVYNGADIDGAKVLWARELTPEQNAKLFAYFKDRQIWLVTPDVDNTYLQPYSPPPPQPPLSPAPPE